MAVPWFAGGRNRISAGGGNVVRIDRFVGQLYGIARSTRLSIAAWLALLGISYGWVRRSGRDLLGLVWQYLLAVVPLNIVHLLASAWVFGVRSERIGFDEGEVDPVWIGCCGWHGLAMALAVLVWFARRASRDGFDKAVILIGVVAFPGVNLLAESMRGVSGTKPGLVSAKGVVELHSHVGAA